MARDLMEKRRYRQALFFAELAIEKTLKAMVVQETGEMPPRTHDLLGLARRAGIDLPEDRGAFLARFQQYNIEGRYPEHLPAAPSLDEAEKGMEECEETIGWLTTHCK